MNFEVRLSFEVIAILNMSFFYGTIAILAFMVNKLSWRNGNDS